MVIDGITIGHLCCGVHGCKQPLASNQNRFCSIHTTQDQICSIVGCTSPVSSGRQVCSDLTHISMEDLYHLHGQSHFQLQNQLQCACMAGVAIGAPSNKMDINKWAELDKEVFGVNADGEALPATIPQASSGVRA